MNIQKLIDKHKENILKKNHVVGIGYGYGEGKKSDTECFRIYVDKKLPEDQLDPEDIAPKKLEGKLTDVIEVGEIKALSFWSKLISLDKLNRKSKHRPIPGGVSIGNIKISAGTKGHEVIISKDWSKDTLIESVSADISALPKKGERLMLSNAHVFCENPFKDVSENTLLISQPGPYDDPNFKNNRIGNLVSHVKLSTKRVNYVDAALCRVNDVNDLNSEILKAPNCTGTAEPELNMSVLKSGRTTGLTYGKIVDVNATVRVSYGNNRTCTFTDQIIIKGDTESFSRPGDSGSLISSLDGKAVGLLFAGSSTVTVGNKIKNVLKVFKAEIVTEDSEDIIIDFIVERIKCKKNVRGTVREKINNSLVPVEKAVITLKSCGGDFKSETWTDSKGKYKFTSVKEGKYKISFKKEGYKTQTKELNI